MSDKVPTKRPGSAPKRPAQPPMVASHRSASRDVNHPLPPAPPAGTIFPFAMTGGWLVVEPTLAVSFWELAYHCGVMKTPTHCPSGQVPLCKSVVRKCNSCEQTKPTSDFYPRKTKPNADGTFKLNPMCKVCQKAYHAKHYEANKSAYIGRAVQQKVDLAEFIDALKAGPCTDCGGRFPACAMDFDHLSGKSFGISRAKRRYMSREKILAEVAKCELVCSNCHRVRTRDRAKAAGVWTPAKAA